MDNRPLIELIPDLQSARLVALRLEGQCAATCELIPPPTMIEVETLRTTAEQIGTLTHAVAASEQQLTILRPLTTAPELDDEISLTQDVRALTQATAALRRLEVIHSQLAVLVAAPDMADTREIEAIIRDLAGATAAVASRKQDFVQAEQALREVEHQLRTWAEQQQLCPTCGGPLDPNQIVLHAGSCVGGPHA